MESAHGDDHVRETTSGPGAMRRGRSYVSGQVSEPVTLPPDSVT